MALFPLRGVLVEYGANILGPIPNIVIFQFNPGNMTRTITIPPPPASASARPRVETHAAAAPPSERLEISAHFSAADDLGAGGAVSAIPRLFGVGPQIAALEKMGGGSIAIVGHTDVRASHAYNLALGMRRAKAVYEALAQRLSPQVRANVRVEASNDPTAPVGVRK